MEHLREWVELTAQAIEALAVLIMVVFILIGTARWLLEGREAINFGYTRYRVMLGKALLIGLELLVAADIIRTVALEPTLLNMATLGVLVVVRTFLGWTLTVEVEGHWPWQAGKGADRDRG
ncbi:MAG: DUF1622 domain-containing protein [Burkholderiales bacterium]